MDELFEFCEGVAEFFAEPVALIDQFFTVIDVEMGLTQQDAVAFSHIDATGTLITDIYTEN